MTNEEALKALTILRGVIKHCDEFEADIEDVIDDDPIELVNVSMSAIKKQTPMIPKRSYRCDVGCVIRLCPRCEQIEFGLNRPKYCNECGQALDWEGEDD